MNWKRVIARTSIIACLSIPFTGCGDDVDTTPRPSVANLERLKKGMAPAEAEKIMGKPKEVTDPTTMEDGQPYVMHVWETDAQRFVVGFKSGKLENAAYTDK